VSRNAREGRYVGKYNGLHTRAHGYLVAPSAYTALTVWAERPGGPPPRIPRHWYTSKARIAEIQARVLAVLDKFDKATDSSAPPSAPPTTKGQPSPTRPRPDSAPG
jgi:hypothetical protein